MAELRFNVPTPGEQRAIADYLDRETARIDALIEKKQQAVALLGERDECLLEQTFFPATQTQHNDEHKADGVPLTHRRVSQLRRLVKATNAGEVIDKSWWGDGAELLYTCAQQPLTSNFEDFPPWKRTHSGDLLLTRNGTPYVHLPEVGAIYSNVVQRISLREGLDRTFVALALEAAAHRMKAQGVSIDSFNYDMWKALPVPERSLAEQRRIATALERQRDELRSAVSLIGRQTALLREHRQALITAAVTGDLDIAEAA
jgi:type I restriction enzyme S subunit